MFRVSGVDLPNIKDVDAVAVDTHVFLPLLLADSQAPTSKQHDQLLAMMKTLGAAPC